MDPTQIGRFRPTPAVNVILDSLGVAEESPVAWEATEDPKPKDVVAQKGDYALRPGDLVQISIYELFQEGVPLTSQFLISETGKISIPEVGLVQAAGLTETQLEDEIKRMLSPNILKEPTVTVILMDSQQRTFSVMGNGVPRPGRYLIPRYDFRLTDALATAGGPMQFNVSYVYVSRKSDSSNATAPDDLGGSLNDDMKTITPSGASQQRTAPSYVPPLGYAPTGSAQAAPPARLGVLPPDSTRPTPTTGLGVLPPDGTRATPATGLGILPPDPARAATPRGITAPPSPMSADDTELQIIQPSPGGQRTQALSSATPLSPSQPAVVPSTQGDIPEPKEPAEKFELERQMMDLISPSAKKTGPPAETAVAAAPAPSDKGGKKKDEDVAASVMPYGFKLLTPPKPREEPKAAEPPKAAAQKSTQKPVQKPAKATDVVQTPIVLADEGNAPAQAASPASTAGQGFDWVQRNGQWVPVPKSGVVAAPQPQETVTGPAANGASEWVFRNGQWVQIPKGQPVAATAPPVGPEIRGPTLPLDGEELPSEMEWEQSVQGRVLRIPAEKLLAGDQRYNVVIKPGDTVYVPVDIIGEFFIMGNVNRAGVINITGRPMTLKMAIAAAGGLGPLAWPKNVEVIRRIGRDKEEIVMVDLDKIAAGEQPDFFIKPLDQINVGTHPTARFRAVLRNAFRAAYGFGFVYDRNFADADYGKGFVLPHWL